MSKARSFRDGILRRLENLRKRHPFHYAQLVVMPMPLPPSYAMDDKDCPWWSSLEAGQFWDSLNENNLE